MDEQPLPNGMHSVPAHRANIVLLDVRLSTTEASAREFLVTCYEQDCGSPSAHARRYDSLHPCGVCQEMPLRRLPRSIVWN